MTRANKKGPPVRRRRRRGRPHPPTDGADDQPVPLHKRSASHFQRDDRQRGQEYFNEDRVRLAIDGTRARARVEGTERDAYRVGLDWSRIGQRVLHAFCECPRFADRRPCKHLWATLLALAETEPEKQPPGRDRVSLRKDRAASWRDLGVAAAPGDQGGKPGRVRPGQRAHHARPSRRQRRPHPSAPLWQSQLRTIHDEILRISESTADGDEAADGPTSEDRVPGVPPGFDVRFLINTAASLNAGGMVLDIFGQPQAAPKGRTAGPPDRRTANRGTRNANHRSKRRPASQLKRLHLEPEALEALLQPEESETPLGVVAALPAAFSGPKTRGRRKPPGKQPPQQVESLRLPPALYERVLPHLCRREALSWWDGRRVSHPQPLSWDAGPPWRLALRLEVADRGGARLTGGLERENGAVPLSKPLLILTDGLDGPAAAGGPALVVFADTVARLETRPQRDQPWIEQLRGTGDIVIPKDDLEEALTTLLELPELPRLETPDELRLVQEPAPPQPRLVLAPPSGPAWLDPPLVAELSFDYGGLVINAGDPRGAVVDWRERKFIQRDMDWEHGALVRLLELGLRPVASAEEGHDLELTPRELPAVAEPLLAEGWQVEAHGTTLRPASPASLRVESGIDWFELSGSLDFAGDPVELKAILEVISRGDRLIQLGDGSQGVLPASLVEACGSLAQLAHSASDDGLRFLPSQALLVDALLAAMPPADVNGTFVQLREKLQSFDRIKPKKELKSFQGELRGYQRQGLGWLEFLREFGLGGVLADDMGLGKTVQVLALLHAHRTPAKSTGLPSLVVAPRSLVYNWIDEAARFTPKLRTVEYVGAGREALKKKLDKYDLLVTTYGTMRRDIGYLATVEFDTVILDEAQAIKNPASQTAKASGLLVARHRLALTGTPIENHLGELGSIFEFLNPGLLGRLPKLGALTSGRAASRHELKLVFQGIRPFILRRTKAQVLPDLPPKTEQVLFCALRPEQRELYDRVRATYQATLLKQVETKGVGGSTIQVLEALLRLRQVACHPGLVDKAWEEAGSAKLEALFEQVAEVLDEGHKILVFSQFTSLLAYVRRHFDAEGVDYAYLDGQTRDRAAAVERFQTDPQCNLFLVSLKAGGFGLNLTAAGYVFLLDPWWNPAVEAQAIDRAHRIGQTQPVFAYRMIARDTVEEKMLELQRSKRHLADAVLEGDGTPLKELTAEDLRALLS